MRGIEVIILQSRGKPLLSQSTSDKELSVTPNNRYSSIGALLKSGALTSTLKPHLSQLWPKKHDAFPSGSSGSCTAGTGPPEHIAGMSLHCDPSADAEGTLLLPFGGTWNENGDRAAI